MEILDGAFGSRPLYEVFHYEAGWELPPEEDRAAIVEIMAGRAPAMRVRGAAS
jgi:hypothetical protein